MEAYAGFSYTRLIVTAALQLLYSLAVTITWLLFPLSSDPAASWKCGVRPSAANGGCSQSVALYCLANAACLSLLVWLFATVYSRLCSPQRFFSTTVMIWTSVGLPLVHVFGVDMVLLYSQPQTSAAYRYLPVIMDTVFLLLFVSFLWLWGRPLFHPKHESHTFLFFSLITVGIYAYCRAIGVFVLSKDALSNDSGRIMFTILFPIPCVIARFIATRSLSRFSHARSAGILSLSLWFFPCFQYVFLKAVTLKIQSVPFLIVFQTIVLSQEIFSNAVQMSQWFFRRFVWSRARQYSASVAETPAQQQCYSLPYLGAESASLLTPIILSTAEEPYTMEGTGARLDTEADFQKRLLLFREEQGMAFYHQANAQRLSVFLFLTCMVFARYSWNAPFYVFSLSELSDDRFREVLLFLGIVAIVEWASSTVTWGFILKAYNVNALLLGGFELVQSRSLSICVTCGASAIICLFLCSNLLQFS